MVDKSNTFTTLTRQEATQAVRDILEANPGMSKPDARDIAFKKHGAFYWFEDGSIIPYAGQKITDAKISDIKNIGGDYYNWMKGGKDGVLQGIKSQTSKQDRNVRQGGKRTRLLEEQQVGNKTFPTVPKGSGLEAHHKRMIQLYSPLFEGLSEADKLKLATRFVEMGMPLGDKLENADILPKGPHKAVHNFIEDITGKLKEFPDFGKTLEDRIFHAKNFYKDIVQPSIDEKTIKIMQNYRAENLYKYMQYYGSELGSITKNGSNGTNGTNGTNGVIKNGAKALLKNTGAVLSRIPKPVKKAGVLGLAGIPILGAGLDVNAAQHDIREAIKDPTGKNIRYAVGSTIEAVDQFTPGVGSYVNASLRAKPNKDMTTEELVDATSSLVDIK